MSLERIFDRTGLVGRHPCVKGEGLAGNSQLCWSSMDFVLFDEVFVDARMFRVVPGSEAKVFRRRKHGAFDFTSLGEQS